MRVFAVANQKGGVGKTTTTVNTSAPLAAAGRRTLLLDLDPHGSLTSYFGYDPDSVKKSTYHLFQTDAPDPSKMIVQTSVKNLDLMPANSALATLDRQLGVQEGKGLVIVDALAKLKDKYSYVFIDCPPILGVLMVNALAACERLVVPVQAEFLSLKGLERMIRTLNMITQARGHKLPYLIVPTMFDKRTRAARESLTSLRETYPYNIWDEVIPIDTRFRDASKLGYPLTMLNPGARGAKSYRQLLTALLRKTHEDELARAKINSEVA
ncbi:MAG: ParA family protein [Gammaproteobacteria bacterium]|nr:ParA family protein [Gammaproteobacteria bacterium]